MKALTISSHGGLDNVEFRDDVAIPELRSPTDVRLRMEAGALNHLDVFTVGGLPGIRITPPWILGADGIGVVESTGTQVTRVRVGDRVVVNGGISCRACNYCRSGESPLCVKFGLLGEHFPGTLAEYLVLPATNVEVVPASADRFQGAGFALAALTAHRMISGRARVQQGEDVLVQGIGGGVALAALQLAKAAGARVWVTSSSDEKLARARSHGADETINYTTTDVAKEVRARTGKRGVDVVIDNVGVATWKQSLGALGRHGRLVTCGATTGPIVETDVRRLFWNQWSIMGSTMGNDEEFRDVVRAFTSGKYTPVIDSVFPLSDGRAAMERLASGKQFGKIVLDIAG